MPGVMVAGLTVMVEQVTVSRRPADCVLPQLSVAVTVMMWVPAGRALAMVTTPLARFAPRLPLKVGEVAVSCVTEPLSEGAKLGVTEIEADAATEVLA